MFHHKRNVARGVWAVQFAILRMCFIQNTRIMQRIYTFCVKPKQHADCYHGCLAWELNPRLLQPKLRISPLTQYVVLWCVCVCVCVCVWSPVRFQVSTGRASSLILALHIAPLADLFICSGSLAFHLFCPKPILGNSGARRPRVCTHDRYTCRNPRGLGLTSLHGP